ncbi:MAG: hypothetical protein HN392_06070 [Anaerolineae bacterium]|jgi:hypothetical protein|nr:hypothetical protein [Anaerolineae bacterium]MBT7073754.1 hypothetical protein [Anaerolineae bacterium]MBT7783399.1 hypothetical protein [Anaerolineae bacterium]
MDFKHFKPDRFGKSVRFFNLIFILFFLAGCKNTGALPPTPFPDGYLPTVVALTAAALPSPTLATQAPTATLTSTSTPSPIPSITSTLPPTSAPSLPLPAVRILSPGEMSKVISPIVLKSYIRPGADGKITVELLGEDGRLLARDIFYQYTIFTEGTYVKLEIPFETRAAAEIGRLQISTEDDLGRPLEIFSTRLLLLSIGKDDLNRGNNAYPRAVFFYPKAEAEISDGILPVIGEMQAYNDTPVIIELLDEDGKTLGLRTLSLPAGIREKFETTIEYKVSEPVSARLVIRQADKGFEGRVYLHSQIVILNP